MKNQLSLRLIGAIALAIIGGACLGYFQDNITTNLLPFSIQSVFLIVGMVCWFVCIVWYAMAFQVSWLHRLGIKPTLQGLIFILLCWVFTAVGGVVFLSLNGTAYMSLFGMILLSAGMAMAYNFFLVVLPLFIFWGIRSALHRPRRGRSSRAN